MGSLWLERFLEKHKACSCYAIFALLQSVFWARLVRTSWLVSWWTIDKIFRETQDLLVSYCVCCDFTVITVFLRRLVTIQLTYFMANKVVQWHRHGKIVPIFHKQTEDNCCEIVYICTTRNQDSLHSCKSKTSYHHYDKTK